MPREPPFTILRGVAYERQNLQQATSFLILQYVHLPIDHCDDSLTSQYSFYHPKAKVRRDPLRLLRAERPSALPPEAEAACMVTDKAETQKKRPCLHQPMSHMLHHH